MQRFMRELSKPDGGLAAYGEEEVRRMLTMGAVETLILSEKLRKYRVNVTCESCAYTKVDTTTNPDFYASRLGPCPECGKEVEMGEEEDIVAELSDLAESMGSSVKIIGTASDEGDLLHKAFGGMAAVLRFRA